MDQCEVSVLEPSGKAVEAVEHETQVSSPCMKPEEIKSLDDIDRAGFVIVSDDRTFRWDHVPTEAEMSDPWRTAIPRYIEVDGIVSVNPAYEKAEYEMIVIVRKDFIKAKSGNPFGCKLITERPHETRPQAP